MIGFFGWLCKDKSQGTPQPKQEKSAVCPKQLRIEQLQMEVAAANKKAIEVSNANIARRKAELEAVPKYRLKIVAGTTYYSEVFEHSVKAYPPYQTRYYPDYHFGYGNILDNTISYLEHQLHCIYPPPITDRTSKELADDERSNIMNTDGYLDKKTNTLITKYSITEIRIVGEHE